MQETDEPDLVVDLPDTEELACEDLAEIDFAVSVAVAAAAGDADGAVVEWVVWLRRRLIDTPRRCIEVSRIGAAQRLVVRCSKYSSRNDQIAGLR